MFTVCKELTFAAGHAIRGHQGGCQNLHGHNYRVRIWVSSRELDALGMVLDFAALKQLAVEVLGPFDHRVLNDVPPFDTVNTTAELFARHVYDEIAKRLPDERGLALRKVEVWETDSAGAVYEP
jgi:6-pyruvoyltetrahydropterin/6-carboxytetrahydropterin synthase